MPKDSFASSLAFYQIRQREEVFRAKALSMSYKCSKVGLVWGYQGLKVLAAPQEAPLELPTSKDRPLLDTRINLPHRQTKKNIRKKPNKKKKRF